MKESLQKAIQMEQFAEGSLTSSMIDDTFYILKKSRDRAVISGNFNCVCAVINHIGEFKFNLLSCLNDFYQLTF